MPLLPSPLLTFCSDENLLGDMLERGEVLDEAVDAEHSSKKSLDKKAFVYVLIEYAMIAGIATLPTLKAQLLCLASSIFYIGKGEKQR